GRARHLPPRRRPPEGPPGRHAAGPAAFVRLARLPARPPPEREHHRRGGRGDLHLPVGGPRCRVGVLVVPDAGGRRGVTLGREEAAREIGGREAGSGHLPGVNAFSSWVIVLPFTRDSLLTTPTPAAYHV